MAGNEALAWDLDGRDWPNRSSSRFVHAGGLRWLVQQMGSGPVALLLHGTGASTHSWRDLMPALAGEFTVVAMDLPGHAFTRGANPDTLSLPGMARAVQSLVQVLGVDVAVVVGHSAGAAIGARLVLDRRLTPALMVALNGAFFPLDGLAGWVFPAVARLMAATPWASRVFARRSWDHRSVERLIAGTGSRLDARGIDLYGRLVRNPLHAAGALQMMARWDLFALDRDLARWRTPLCLIVGDADRTVSPQESARLRRCVPASVRCTQEVLHAAGHLAHEERPAEVARLISAAYRAVLADPSTAAASQARQRD